jgi:hypothetical protein
MKQELMRNNGSVQDIPQDQRLVQNSLVMKDIIDMSRHRGL